jgi:MFS family permease
VRFLRDLRHLLRGRDFRRLFAVRIVSQLGDGVFQVALASYILFSPERLPTPGAIAGAFAAVLLPFSILGPFTGVLLDRWSRRQVLVLSNLARVLPVLALAIVVAADITGPVLFGLILVELSINRFLLAALSAGLPHVVARGELVMANAVTPTSGTLAFMAGLATGTGVRAGATTLGGSGNVVVLIATAGIYVAAALLATRMSPELLGPDLDVEAPPPREAVRHIARGLVAGARYLRRTPAASLGLAAIGSHRFFYGLSTVGTILLYRNYFNDPADSDAGLQGLSIAVLVSGLGFFSAALVTPYATRRLGKQRWIVVLLGVACVAEVVPGGFFTEPAVLAAAYVLGLCAQGIKICVDTLVQESVDDSFRGRVFAIYDVIFNVSFVAAAAVGALVLPVTGKSYPVLAAIAAGYALTGLAYARLTADALVRTSGLPGEPT